MQSELEKKKGGLMCGSMPLHGGAGAYLLFLLYFPSQADAYPIISWQHRQGAEKRRGYPSQRPVRAWGNVARSTVRSMS